MALSTNLKGFTLIEVLISLVIFSIILTITSIFLTSSIDTLGISQSKSQKIKDIGTASILFRRDVRQSANLPIRNFEFFCKLGINFIEFVPILFPVYFLR